MTKSPVAAASATFLRPQWLIVAALVALLTYAAPQLQQLTSPTQPPSALKSYPDLRSFRSRYQDDHQNETSVILHAVGTSFVLLIVLANPELLGGGVLALKCGQLAFDAFRHHDTGVAEALVVLVVFFATTRFLGGSALAVVATLVCGYACAWTGHFFFEGNRPATFIYPTYSLVCDLIMWAEVVTGVRISL